MPNTYVKDLKRIVNTLLEDDGLLVEEKVILLRMMAYHITSVTDQLESRSEKDTAS